MTAMTLDLPLTETFQPHCFESCVTAADFRKRILKLRWIGLEAEALQLARALEELAPEQGAALWCIETD